MLKKLRYIYWIFLGFARKHTKLLALGIVIGILGAFTLPRIFRLLPKTKHTKKIAVIDKPTISDIPQFIQQEISLGLTSVTPSWEATPSLAKSYTSENDGKQYRFFLRDDVIWHDGKPFTAHDISYNFSDVEMEVVSDYEVIFKLRDPYSPFPTIVSQPIFRSQSSKIFPRKITLLGAGSMKVEKISRNGQHITEMLLKSKDSTKLYRFYNTQEAAVLAFKLGEVDQILELSSPELLVNWPNLKIEEVVHPDRYVALFFNTQDPDLLEKSTRQGLAYAVPSEIKDSQRTISPINPNSWAYNPQVKPYNYDLESAGRLLSGDQEGAEPPPLKLELTTTLPYLDTAEAIKNEWSKLGIQTTIKVAIFFPDNFQILLIAQETPPDPDQYSLWHSTQPTNITRYNSPKVDKLLEDGRQTIDKNQRTLIYQDFQRFLVEDTPAAFLFHHTTYDITRS